MSAQRVGKCIEVEREDGYLVIGDEVSLVGAAVVRTSEDAIALIRVLLDWLEKSERVEL